MTEDPLILPTSSISGRCSSGAFSPTTVMDRSGPECSWNVGTNMNYSFMETPIGFSNDSPSAILHLDRLAGSFNRKSSKFDLKNWYSLFVFIRVNSCRVRVWSVSCSCFIPQTRIEIRVVFVFAKFVSCKFVSDTNTRHDDTDCQVYFYGLTKEKFLTKESFCNIFLGRVQGSQLKQEEKAIRAI
ncbi:hypothetical protein LXL04_013682 [Taraxacum kok-saghyz]